MWDFPQYTSGERAFSFFQGVSETVGGRARAQTSKTALRIYCKSFLEYLGVLVSAGDSSGCLECSDSGGGEESGGATEGATEGVTEGATEGVTEGAMEGATKGRSRRGRPWPWTEIISELELIFV